VQASHRPLCLHAAHMTRERRHRLVDMGSTISARVSLIGWAPAPGAQTVLECRKPSMADAAQLRVMGIAPPTHLYSSQGCSACSNSGYRGAASMNVMVDDDFRG